MNRLMNLADAAELIRSGAFLSLAGPESALDTLPQGNWVAGTIPYFMDSAGGVVSTEGQVFVTPLPATGTATLTHYAADQLKSIVGNGPDNGFTIAIVPAGSAAHKTFAAEAVNDADAFLKPTVGWVAGVVRWFQSGYLYHYALAMILGIVVLMSYFVTWPMLAAWLSR